MMRLDQVEIVGFKSFCDKQELTFKGGVTGIVGPNGCGKSNISDAISWVLGEQSAKSLRGGAMSDVIFAGTTARQPVGMAEVNLKVTGLNGKSPDGREECTISRRLYRNGESEYLMNGQVCRLRDIHELFMDTGLGSKAYSFIEQGKIGQILSNKPADRRALIEEAAGITKYRARRRQTQLKLDATQQNLLRVNDIITEVEKQLESLKRQAAKARRRLALEAEKVALDRLMYGRTFEELHTQANRLAERSKVETENAERIQGALTNEEAQLEVKRAEALDKEKSLEEVRAKHAEITLVANRHETHAGYCRDQSIDAMSRATAALQEAEDLRARLSPVAETVRSHENDLVLFAQERQENESALSGLDALVEAAIVALRGVEVEMESARSNQLSALTRISALNTARVVASERVERAQASLVKLQAELDEVQRERARIEETLVGVRAKSEGQEKHRTELNGELEKARAEKSAAEAERGDLSKELEALHSDRNQTAGRRASLEELVATHAAFDQGVRSLLDNRGESQIVGVLADLIEVSPEHEKAVEGFLGDALQSLVVPTADMARVGVERLSKEGLGRASFLVLDRGPGACAEVEDVRDSRVVARLCDLYRIALPQGRDIQKGLCDALVVRTLDDALALSASVDSAIVTLDGDVVRGSWVEGGRGGRGFLAPRREVKELKEREGDIETRLGEAKRREGEAAARIDAALDSIRKTEELQHENEKALLSLEHERVALEEELQRLSRKNQVIDVEVSQGNDEKSQGEERIREIDGELHSAEGERTSLASMLLSLGTSLAASRLHTEERQNDSRTAKSRLAALVEKEASTQRLKERFSEEYRDLEERIASAMKRKRDLEEKSKTLEAERTETEKSLTQALHDRDAMAGEVALREDRLREARADLDQREESLKARRRERDQVRDGLSEIEVSQARTASDMEHLARESHAALGVTAAEAAAQFTDEERMRDLDVVRAAVEDLREKIERIGPINPLAVQESQENEERFAFMSSQRADLLESIKDLENTITNIDKTCKERFEEAFHIINANFQETFKQLFGGGQAGLALNEEEGTGILEAGIDIMAQPPGKKLQNVLLLSGGEKAMTAIALLFSIFKFKPSPFCILDEVDAPLDDANIGRFVKMLDTIRGDTQFIIITHSRKTMQIADQLYGVTMEEPGVSKLVSVKFN